MKNDKIKESESKRTEQKTEIEMNRKESQARQSQTDNRIEWNWLVYLPWKSSASTHDKTRTPHTLNSVKFSQPASRSRACTTSLTFSFPIANRVGTIRFTMIMLCLLPIKNCLTYIFLFFFLFFWKRKRKIQTELLCMHSGLVLSALFCFFSPFYKLPFQLCIEFVVLCVTLKFENIKCIGTLYIKWVLWN